MISRQVAWGLGVVGLLGLGACGGGSLNNVGDTGEAGNSGVQAGASGAFAGSGGRRNGGGGTNDGFSGGGSGFGGNDVGGNGVGGNDVGGNGFGGTGAGGNVGGNEVGGFGNFGGANGFGGAGGFGNFGGASGFGGATSGAGGADGGGGGSSGAFPGCFGAFEVYAQEDVLDMGPQNTVLLDAHIASGDVRNTANQAVFPNAGGIWEVYANYPATTPEVAAKTDILLPAQLATVPDNLGQLYVTRRSCAGQQVAGRKLKVEVWWKTGTSFVNTPTHGVALGVVGPNDATTWLADATKPFVIGDTDPKRSLDTLNRVILQHAFAADDTTDARKLVLGLWLLDSKIFPTNFYIGNVQWE